MLLDDAYMPPVAAVVDHLRGSAAWALEEPVSFRTAVARKLAEEMPNREWKGERIGGRMSFRYLPPRRRARRRCPPAVVQHASRPTSWLDARAAGPGPFRRPHGLTLGR